MSDDVLVPDRLLATARPPQPYPGLRPFEMEEWSIFFGRERMIDEVIELLARQRLVVVHDASGSGKSSLIRAGVLPRLRTPAPAPWRAVAHRGDASFGRAALEPRGGARATRRAGRRRLPR